MLNAVVLGLLALGVTTCEDEGEARNLFLDTTAMKLNSGNHLATCEDGKEEEEEKGKAAEMI